MKTAKSGHYNLIIKLDPGDEIIGSLETICREHNWVNASVTGLGSVENPTLAHYRIDNKKFTQKSLSGIFEITSLIGNVALFEDRPLAHAHVTLADDQMQAFGGHLVDGHCSASCELIVTKLDSRFEKSFDPDVGLKTWNLI